MGAGVLMTRWDRQGPWRTRVESLKAKELDLKRVDRLLSLKSLVDTINDSNKEQVFNQILDSNLLNKFAKMMKLSSESEELNRKSLIRIPTNKMKYLLKLLLDKEMVK